MRRQVNEFELLKEQLEMKKGDLQVSVDHRININFNRLLSAVHVFNNTQERQLYQKTSVMSHNVCVCHYNEKKRTITYEDIVTSALLQNV